MSKMPDIIYRLEEKIVKHSTSQMPEVNSDEYLLLAEYEEITQDIDAILVIRYLALYCTASYYIFFNQSSDRSELLSIMAQEFSCLLPKDSLQGIDYLKAKYPFIYRSGESVIDLYRERAIVSTQQVNQLLAPARKNHVDYKNQFLIRNLQENALHREPFQSPAPTTSSPTCDYKLIVVNQNVSSHGVEICTISLTGIHERYPRDYFYSSVSGEGNRRKLQDALNQKLSMEISSIVLDQIISRWVEKIKMNQLRAVVKIPDIGQNS
jgi:hypothetical protein